MAKLVYGVGFNSRKYPAYIDDVVKKEYRLWKGMLERCYSEKLHIKRNTYIGCEVSDNFKNYEYFHDWCQNQIGFNQAGYHLDKDILFKGNKIYSEDMSVFIPHEINSMMTKTNSKRGKYPIGVSLYKKNGKFHAQQTCGEKTVHIGYFDTPEGAFFAYKKDREHYIKSVADKYKHQIDPRVYEALMNYTVDITD